MRILLIDNYDSFTFNLLHYLKNGGAEVKVVRNDALSLSDLKMEFFDAALLSPGPCEPKDAGQLMDFVRINRGKKPILGVCLGMQALAISYHWKLIKAAYPMHGKQSLVEHDGDVLFQGIPNPMLVGRYHSLIVSPPGVGNLKSIAHCNGEVMAIRDLDELVYGVQFHPESILTPFGQKIIDNWLKSERHRLTINFQTTD